MNYLCIRSKSLLTGKGRFTFTFYSLSKSCLPEKLSLCLTVFRQKQFLDKRSGKKKNTFSFQTFYKMFNETVNLIGISSKVQVIQTVFKKSPNQRFLVKLFNKVLDNFGLNMAFRTGISYYDVVKSLLLDLIFVR